MTLRLDSTPTGIYVVDRGGAQVFCGADFIRMCGGDFDSLTSVSVSDMEEKEYVGQSALLAAIWKKQRVNCVDNHLGYFCNQLITATPLFDEDTKMNMRWWKCWTWRC